MEIKQPCFIDTSHWEIVDWNNVDPRVLGVIFKVSQGKYYVDPTAKAAWIGAGNKKLPRSGYHFFEANDISSQVANFLTACEDIRLIVSGRWMGEIEPVLDAEYAPEATVSKALRAVGFETSRLPVNKLRDLRDPKKFLLSNPHMAVAKSVSSAAVTGAQLAAQYKAWLDLVEAELSIKPIIYTSYWFWMHTGFPAWEGEYKLWDAQYPYNPDGQTKPLYFPYGHWKDWWAWQYSASASMQGITGFVDVDVFNGTVQQWQEQYGGVPIPPPQTGKIVIKIRS